MIFCNWISQKAGDKVPHTPLILPISTAGLKRALLRRWMWSEEAQDGARSEEERGDRLMKTGVGSRRDRTRTSCGRRADVSQHALRPDRHRHSGSVMGRRRQSAGDSCGKGTRETGFNVSDHNSKHSDCCCQKWSGTLPSQQAKQISFAESQETVHFRTPWQMPLRKEDRRGKLSAPSERLQSVWEDASKILDLTTGELGSPG